METLITAVKSLIFDVESMQEKDDPNYFGRFSEFDTDMATVSIEWPNLAISLEGVKKSLQGHQTTESVMFSALQVIKDSITGGLTENGLPDHRVQLTDGTWLEGQAAKDWRNMLVAFRDIAEAAITKASANG